MFAKTNYGRRIQGETLTPAQINEIALGGSFTIVKGTPLYAEIKDRVRI